MGSCPTVPVSFWGTRRRKTKTHSTPPSTKALQSCSPSKNPPPLTNRGISQWQKILPMSGSTEVIKHGQFGVMNAVRLPLADPDAYKHRNKEGRQAWSYRITPFLPNLFCFRFSRSSRWAWGSRRLESKEHSCTLGRRRREFCAGVYIFD